jgi:hypothetical protein
MSNEKSLLTKLHPVMQKIKFRRAKKTSWYAIYINIHKY